MKKYDFDLDPFGRAFTENKDKTINERISLGLKEAAKYMSINFPDNCMLPTVDLFDFSGGSTYTYKNGIYANADKYDALIENNPEYAEKLGEIKKEMLNYDTWFKVNDSATTGYQQRLMKAHACWGGSWIGHANLDYDRLLHMGTDGIRQFIEDCREKNPDKDWFYDAAKNTMDAIDILGERIVIETAKKAETETDEIKKSEWRKISETFKTVPKKPAYDIYSAVMMFWLVFTFDGIDSPGRFDQFMLDYYNSSSSEENVMMIHRLLEAIHNVRAWNLCISGSDSNWNDETNDLSYEILKQVTKLNYQTPNLTLRVHRNTPQKIWEMAADCIGTGIGLPAIYNDEVVCSALVKIGIPDYDAHDYCMNGCNQIDIMGKSHMGLEDGEVNFGKVLELMLHNGFSFSSDMPEMICHQFGNVSSCKTFENFMALFYKYLDHVTDVAVDMSNQAQEEFAYFAPNPLRSCLIQGCLESGKDYKMGGPLYGHGQILAEGIADTSDSLWAIKTLVYDKKKYTIDELIKALEANYEGYGKLHFDFSNCEKFGNDLPEPDEFCAQIVDHFLKYLKTKRTFRGGIYTGGCSPFNRAAENGAAVAALPNGRKKGDSNYADSIAATPGNDINGPTAALKSMMHYNQKEACSGFVTQMKFDKKLFATSKGKEAIINLAKVYFLNGGQQLSVNVLDRETLLKAQKDPMKYKNLIVRVGGYSDYFCNLSPELQQNVIDRTEFAMG